MVNTQNIPASASTQDPITRDFTHISTESLEIRQLTVGYGMYRVRGPEGRTTSIPMLRLQGAWLERAGFLVGRTAKVHVSFGQLVIEAAEPERVSNEDGMPRRELDAR